MSTDFTTKEFVKLRNFFQYPDTLDEGLTELRDACNNIFLKCEIIFKEKNTEDFIDCAYEVWDLLSIARAPYTLPSKYTDNNLKNTLNHVFQHIFFLQTTTRKPQGANMVLNGIKGVGKTTILHVAGAIAACLTTSVIPLYWIYEKNNPSLQYCSTYILSAAVKQYYFDNNNDDMKIFDDYVEEFSKKNSANIGTNFDCSKILFLLDEFTTLYNISNSENYQIGMNILCEFRSIARNRNIHFLMAAPCINVQKYIFPDRYHSSLSQYPNLNCGLFSVYHINPIRNVKDIQIYWTTRYKKHLSPEEAQHILNITGGVGRFMELYNTGISMPNNIRCEYIQSDVTLFHICCHCLLRPWGTAELLNYTTVDNMDRFIDELLLYNDGNSVDFLFNSLKEEFRSYLVNKELLNEAHIFHLQRKGFIGGSTSHSNENFLSRFLPKRFGLESSQHSLEFKLKDSKLFCQFVSLTTIEIYKEICSLELLEIECSYKLMKWSVQGCENSIDRIWFVTVNGSIQLNALQIKTGKDNAKITCGKIESQRNKTKATQCDDSTIAGIISKVYLY